MRLVFNVLLRCVAVLCLVFLSANAMAGMPCVVKCPKEHPSTEVYVTFLPNATNAECGYYYNLAGDKKTMYFNISYKLSNMISTKSLGTGIPTGNPAFYLNDGLNSKRIYLSYGKMTVDSGGYTPNAGVDSETKDKNFKLRYQYSEFTTDGAYTIDLTYIDFVAIPLNIRVVNPPVGTSNNPQTTSVPGDKLINAAAESAIPARANVRPKGSTLSDGHFARVIGSELAATNGYDFYHNWKDYLAHLATLKETATLNDCFVGAGRSSDRLQQQQAYKYTVEFQGDRVMVTADSGSGNASKVNVCVGDGNTGTGVGDNNKLWILYSDLKNAASGVYSNNTGYTYKIGTEAPVTVASLQNDFFGRVAGDVLAGLSWGFFGSKTLYTGKEFESVNKDKEVGKIHSLYWWGGKNADTVVTGHQSLVTQGYVFEKLQDNVKHYDPYASSFHKMTTGYGIPFGDRVGNNLITIPSFGDKTYVEIVIGSDKERKHGGAIRHLLSED